MQMLISYVHKTPLIGVYDELSMLQVRPPLFNSNKDGEKLLLICGEGPGARAQGLADKGNRMPILKKQSPDTEITSVCLKMEGLGKVKQGQYRDGNQSRFEGAEGRCVSWCPDEQRSFLEQVSKRAGQNSKVLDELAVIPR
jgi:hypothetical protein